MLSRKELNKINYDMSPDAKYGDVFEKIAEEQEKATAREIYAKVETILCNYADFISHIHSKDES